MTCPKCNEPVQPISFVGRFGLSPREAEVSDLVVGGNRLESVAFQLGMALNTVKSHIKSAKRKIGVSGTVGMVRVAFGQEAV